MFDKDAIVKKWTDCCHRGVPSPSMLIMSVIDPENTDQGIRSNIYQPQVDDVVSKINKNNNSNTKKITDKIDEINGNVVKLRQPDNASVEAQDLAAGESRTDENVVAYSVTVTKGSATVSAGGDEYTLSEGKESAITLPSGYQLDSLTISAGADSTVSVVVIKGV